MLAIYLAPFYILACIYTGRWLVLWLGACHDIFKRKVCRGAVILVFGLLALSIPIGFFAGPWGIGRFINQAANIWFGVFAYVILVVLGADLIRIIIRRIKGEGRGLVKRREALARGGFLCLCVILLISIYGVVNAKIIRVTPYSVVIHKDGGSLDKLKIVLVADLHLGYNIGCAQMEQMVEKINGQDPDLVVIAGDIFDNNFDALDDPRRLTEILNRIRSTYGVYACYGNHDVAEPILAGFTFASDKKKQSDPRMDEFLKDSGITLLQDEGVLIGDSFYLFGRADKERPGRGIRERMTPQEITQNIDKDKPVIVIDHEPRELEELAGAGVDLDLAGHTHDGQMFPANILMKFLWENPCGYLQKEQMHSIVTSGVGLFGPNMRVGTRSEICTITVEFHPEQSEDLASTD